MAIQEDSQLSAYAASWDLASKGEKQYVSLSGLKNKNSSPKS
jgi:hypothetical protein